MAGDDEPAADRKQRAAAAGALEAVVGALRAHADEPRIAMRGCKVRVLPGRVRACACVPVAALRGRGTRVYARAADAGDAHACLQALQRAPERYPRTPHPVSARLSSFSRAGAAAHLRWRGRR
eukprot:6720757-Prymnesium_polylepis.2